MRDKGGEIKRERGERGGIKREMRESARENWRYRREREEKRKRGRDTCEEEISSICKFCFLNSNEKSCLGKG